jgi:hypothetical protein
MAANQNVTQLTQQTGSAALTSLFYAVINSATDTGLPLSVLVNNLGLTGTPTAPTASFGTNTTQIATCAYVTTNYAPLSSATFTGSVKVSYSNAVFVVNDTSGTNNAAIGLQNNGTIEWGIRNNSSTNAWTVDRYVSGTLTDSPISIANSTGLVTFADGISTTTVNTSGLATLSSLTTSSATISGGTVNGTSVGATTASSGKFTTVVATSTITPSTTSGIVGTTLGDSANAGSVGEFANGTFSATSMANTTVQNLTSMSLTAGDWDVTGCAVYSAGSSGTASYIAVGASSTSATMPALGSYYALNCSIPNNGTGTAIAPPLRFNLTSTTTVYLVGEVVIGAGTVTATGFIKARRVR